MDREAAAGAAAAAAAAAATASSPLESRAGCCVVPALPSVCSVCTHPGCPSLPWLRLESFGIKLGACRPIVWTVQARMNLEESSAQIVHSLGKFWAVFVKFIQISSFGWIFRVNLVLIF